MRKYLLDTCICVDFLRGNEQILQKFMLHMEDLYISEVTIAELKYGAKKSQRAQENLKKIDSLISLVNVVKFGTTIETFTDEKNYLRKQGLIIEDFDLLIASAALSIDAILVTNNEKHMARVRDIKIENWNITR